MPVVLIGSVFRVLQVVGLPLSDCVKVTKSRTSNEVGDVVLQSSFDNFSQVCAICVPVVAYIQFQFIEYA